MDDETNKVPLDVFTLVHGAAGVGLGLAGVSFGVTALLAVGWEIIEPTLKSEVPEAFPHPSIDSASNKATDVGAVLLGWWIATQLGKEG